MMCVQVWCSTGAAINASTSLCRSFR